MLSSMYQHVARLQFLSCVEKDKTFSGQHPCFLDEGDFAGLPRKAFPWKQACVDISIFLWLHKQRPKFANGQPRDNFQIKDLDRTTEAIARMNVYSKVEKAEVNVPVCSPQTSVCSCSIVYS